MVRRGAIYHRGNRVAVDFEKSMEGVSSQPEAPLAQNVADSDFRAVSVVLLRGRRREREPHRAARIKRELLVGDPRSFAFECAKAQPRAMDRVAAGCLWDQLGRRKARIWSGTAVARCIAHDRSNRDGCRWHH